MRSALSETPSTATADEQKAVPPPAPTLAPLPARTIADAVPHLRRPFALNAVRWKVQVNPKANGSALLVAYIDARLVAERLNAVCPDLWEDAYAPVDGGLRCLITLTEGGVASFIGDKTILRARTRSDVGWSRGTGSNIDLKTLYSDAFKRAAVKWGVGVSIYALPQAWLSASKMKEVGPANKKTWVVLDTGLADLRKAYAKWLDGPGLELFGPVLDHGDALDSQGDPEDASAVTPPDAAPTEAPAAETKTESEPEAAIDEKVVAAIQAERAGSTRTDEELAVYLAAKVEGVDTGDLDAAIALLDVKAARNLVRWLRLKKAA